MYLTNSSLDTFSLPINVHKARGLPLKQIKKELCLLNNYTLQKVLILTAH